jgi:hypothetical protein
MNFIISYREILSSLLDFSLSFNADRIRIFCSDISEISSGSIVDL